ncbi:MAG TPA: 4Fe-4S dicluster domain-containing protein [Gaiellaceae bacterium]|nr:4Fe-4S dicluster domain-containing protein [Gaiellaceae bacterium]
MARVLSISTATSLARRWPRAFTGPSAPHRIVAETSEVGEGVRLRDRLAPDVIVLELGASREASIDACERLAGGAAPVVALASRLDDDERADLLSAGATGYVLTTVADDGLAIALQAIAEVAGPSSCGPSAPIRAGAEPTSRAEFLRMTGAAAAVATILPTAARAQTTPLETNPSPSAPKALPTLPAPVEGESDLLRMQRELVAAMRKPVGERRWVMVIDLRKCSGCDACTIACKAENQLPPGVVYRPVVKEEVGTYPNVRRRFLPRPCMQCEKPPCTPVCPVGATWRRADGVIAIDYDKCIGCRYCLTACPYSARTTDKGEFYTEGTPQVQPYEEQASPEYDAGFRRADGGSPIGNARKCHFCLHRLEAGQLPACVTSCVGHATFFGDANDPRSLVAELIGRPEARRLKEELGTQPRVYYLT